jgi:hypothetical protein
VAVTSGIAVPPGKWTAFRVKADFATRRWALWVDGRDAAWDLAFYNTNRAAYAAFGLHEGARAAASYVDGVRVWTPTETAPATWTVPFTEPFEETAWGDLDGQRGWTVSGGGFARVQGAVVRSGSGACRLAAADGAPAVVRHAFTLGGDGQARVHCSWFAKPRFCRRGGIGPPTNATAAFYARADGTVVVFDGRDAVALTSKPPLQEGEWTQFETSANYRAGTWSLRVNGTPMAENLAFYNHTAARFSAFGVHEGNIAPSYLDSVRIVTATGFMLLLQ